MCFTLVASVPTYVCVAPALTSARFVVVDGSNESSSLVMPHLMLALPSYCCVRYRGIGCELNPEDDPERVQWAFNEARALLKDNESAFEALRRRLESGGATVGDCVSIIERRTT